MFQTKRIDKPNSNTKVLKILNKVINQVSQLKLVL